MTLTEFFVKNQSRFKKFFFAASFIKKERIAERPRAKRKAPADNGAVAGIPENSPDRK